MYLKTFLILAAYCVLCTIAGSTDSTKEAIDYDSKCRLDNSAYPVKTIYCGYGDDPVVECLKGEVEVVKEGFTFDILNFEEDLRNCPSLKKMELVISKDEFPYYEGIGDKRQILFRYITKSRLERDFLGMEIEY
jgi:hypothetical protein